MAIEMARHYFICNLIIHQRNVDVEFIIVINGTVFPVRCEIRFSIQIITIPFCCKTIIKSGLSANPLLIKCFGVFNRATQKNSILLCTLAMADQSSKGEEENNSTEC